MMRIDTQKLMQKALGKLGRWYIPASVIFVQLISFILAPALLISQHNAQFSAPQFRAALVIWALTGIVCIALTSVWAYFANREACTSLAGWTHGRKPVIAPAEAIGAWRQVNSISLRYIPIAILVAALGQTAPLLTYLYLVFRIAPSQVIYTLLGTMAATVAGTAVAVILLDQLMYPARKLLIPAEFEAQLKGIAHFGIGTKLLGSSASLILLSILLIAPIGYRHTLLAASAAEKAGQTLLSYQIESILVSAIMLALGLLLGYLIVRSLTSPLQSMIGALQSIEAGDLTPRINVTGADEVGQLSIYFNHMIERLSLLQGSLEGQVKDRTAQLNATIQVANAVSAILDVDELTEKVVTLISNEFGYYYVALFLTEASGRWAELRAATGEAGRLLRANNHRLEIGGKNMVGQAISSQEPAVAMDTGEGQIRFDNPLLPYTRSEIALPLLSGGHVLGALDAQSTREADFDDQDIETLKTVANQVAIALENARLFQNAQQNLQDLQAIQQQYLQTSWRSFAEERGIFDYVIGESEPDEAVSEIEIPLTLRDQAIGEINLTSPKAWTPEEMNMIEAIAAQAALALENARLVEEGQSAARRERLVAEITGKIWASATVDGILQTAIKEIGRALETDEVTIELKAN